MDNEEPNYLNVLRRQDVGENDIDGDGLGKNVVLGVTVKRAPERLQFLRIHYTA